MESELEAASIAHPLVSKQHQEVDKLGWKVIVAGAPQIWLEAFSDVDMLSGQKPSLKPAELVLEDCFERWLSGKLRTWRSANLRCWSRRPKGVETGDTQCVCVCVCVRVCEDAARKQRWMCSGCK